MLSKIGDWEYPDSNELVEGTVSDAGGAGVVKDTLYGSSGRRAENTKRKRVAIGRRAQESANQMGICNYHFVPLMAKKERGRGVANGKKEKGETYKIC